MPPNDWPKYEIRVGVQVGRAVAVDVHPDLDLADELHQVDHRLPEAVAAADDELRRGAR